MKSYTKGDKDESYSTGIQYTVFSNANSITKDTSIAHLSLIKQCEKRVRNMYACTYINFENKWKNHDNIIH